MSCLIKCPGYKCHIQVGGGLGFLTLRRIGVGSNGVLVGSYEVESYTIIGACVENVPSCWLIRLHFEDFRIAVERQRTIFIRIPETIITQCSQLMVRI